jgi:hypothetical protein
MTQVEECLHGKHKGLSSNPSERKKNWKGEREGEREREKEGGKKEGRKEKFREESAQVYL